MFTIASRILADAPSPIDTVQITALTPMMTPSIVSKVRMMLARKALRAMRSGRRRRTLSNCYKCWMTAR